MHGFQDDAKDYFSIGNFATSSVKDASQLREIDGEWDEDSISLCVLDKKKVKTIFEVSGLFYPVKSWQFKRFGFYPHKSRNGIDMEIQLPSCTINAYWKWSHKDPEFDY